MLDESTMAGKMEMLASIAENDTDDGLTGAGIYFAQRAATSPQYRDALELAHVRLAHVPANRYIVTVILKKNPDHNPHSKIMGACPLTNDVCTDITGEHHSELCHGESPEHITKMYEDCGFHVTRIEQV
jgi:hypothetical protein